jgi:hypothetical protein
MVTKANQTDASRITSIPLQPRNHHRCCKENMTTDNTNPFPRRLGGRLKPCLGADLEQTRAYAAHEKAKVPKTNPFSHRWASLPQQTDGPPVSMLSAVEASDDDRRERLPTHRTRLDPGLRRGNRDPTTEIRKSQPAARSSAPR